VSWVLDTHALLWAYLGDSRLSAAASRVIAQAQSDELLASDVTLSELARIVSDGHLAIGGDAQDWLKNVASHATILPVSAEIAWLAATMHWEHRDPCDRHIVATALVYRVPLITVDKTIARAAPSLGLSVIW
jgi:PIN domain nuclease of toxin-antitoxin system